MVHMYTKHLYLGSGSNQSQQTLSPQTLVYLICRQKAVTKLFAVFHVIKRTQKVMTYTREYVLYEFICYRDDVVTINDTRTWGCNISNMSYPYFS